MDKEFGPMHREEDSAQEEGFSSEDERSEEELDEDDSDLESGSREGIGWGLLPDVCLRHVFRCLPDRDRRSADMVCHHWHIVMHSPCLWRSRIFYFSGRLSKYRQSEYCSAVTYARTLGAYLERLEVCVYPPRRSSVAHRLEQIISGLFFELIRVRAPLRSLSLVRLELNRKAWTLALRNSLVKCLILFFCRGGAQLTSVCLSGMQNSRSQGLELLSALSHSQRRLHRGCSISSLELQGFFSLNANGLRNSRLPSLLSLLGGLTNLSLGYSCLSDELLMTLQQRHRGQGRRSSSLLTFSLHCTASETDQRLVCGDSWAALASSCPGLKVKLIVDQVINTNLLERMLLREIPLTEYSMTAFYSAEERWSARPVLCDMLPQFRRRLQYLTLDLSNWGESLDEELLELVKVCERLEELKVWAFMEISTVGGLLHIRLTQRRQLNKIRVRIYSVNDDMGEEEDQLEKMLSSFLNLPPELEFLAIMYPSV